MTTDHELGEVEGRLHAVEDRLFTISKQMDAVLTFIDECSGGRKALLLLLKTAGALITMTGILWGMFKTGIWHQ